ncbi:MAG: helix-turn-helix domain-containing protein [archaeon]
MELETLQDLGFTSAEAKVYLTLLKQGPVKVGQVIEKSGLQSSTIHNTLHSLIDKGFVTYIIESKIKIYQSVNPELILKRFKEKQQKFEEIIPRLQSLQKLTKEKPQAEIYEGIKGIISMLYEFIENTKQGDVFRFFAVDVETKNKEIQKFFERYDAKREDKGLVVKGIARKQIKELFNKRKTIKMKYVDFPVPSNVSMCNNKMVLINWGEKPSAIMINSEQLVKSQVDFFDELWEKN